VTQEISVYPPSVVLANVLMEDEICCDPESQGAWPVFAHFTPDSESIPAEVVSLYDTAGIVQARHMEDGVYSQRFGIQVQVRSVNYITAWRMIKVVQLTLLAVRNRTITIDDTTFKIYSMAMASNPNPIGMDDSGFRHVITFNLTTIIKEITDV
jgi:hypothetical protein